MGDRQMMDKKNIKHQFHSYIHNQYVLLSTLKKVRTIKYIEERLFLNKHRSSSQKAESIKSVPVGNHQTE